MTYNSKELSVQDGQPVELFHFTDGTTDWRYTSRARDITVDGVTYTAEQISRSDVTQSGEINKDGISLEFPRTNEFARRFFGGVVDRVITLTIWRGHTTDGDAEYIAYWKGRVVSSKLSGSGKSIGLECESIFTSMKRPGLRARYQRNCRHALYGRGCEVDKDAYKVVALVTSASGSEIVVPAAAGFADGYFLGGMVEAPDGTFRFITSHVGSTLTLARPVASISVAVSDAGYGLSYGLYYGGPSVALYPGCDRSRDTCSTRFSNLDRYGGFPFIPLRNPIDGSSIV